MRGSPLLAALSALAGFAIGVIAARWFGLEAERREAEAVVIPGGELAAAPPAPAETVTPAAEGTSDLLAEMKELELALADAEGERDLAREELADLERRLSAYFHPDEPKYLHSEVYDHVESTFLAVDALGCPLDALELIEEVAEAHGLEHAQVEVDEGWRVKKVFLEGERVAAYISVEKTEQSAYSVELALPREDHENDLLDDSGSRVTVSFGKAPWGCSAAVYVFSGKYKGGSVQYSLAPYLLSSGSGQMFASVHREFTGDSQEIHHHLATQHTFAEVRSKVERFCALFSRMID